MQYLGRLPGGCTALAAGRNGGKWSFRGLPRDFMDYMGAQHSDSKDPRRTAFMEKVRVLVARLGHFAPVDAVADQLSQRLHPRFSALC